MIVDGLRNNCKIGLYLLENRRSVHMSSYFVCGLEAVLGAEFGI